MNVEKIFQIIILKPDGEAILIIKDKGIIQSVNFTRRSFINVWYEVIRTETESFASGHIKNPKISQTDLILYISIPNFPFSIFWNISLRL